MTLNREWIDFVVGLSRQTPQTIAGIQRIYRDVGWSPKSFLDGSMTLEDTGYTQSKLTMLKRNYYNLDSIERAKSDLRWRIDKKKYGSGAFDFRGTPKKNTKQDYCIQSCVISYYPKIGTTVHVFWRTAEVIKRLRGDLVFIRDFILPHFQEEFSDAPITRIDFRFANVTYHPMFSILLLKHLSTWRDYFEHTRIHNSYLFRDCAHWAWYYLCDSENRVEKYSSAAQVKAIALKTTPRTRLSAFKEYIDAAIKEDVESYPRSVAAHYKTLSKRALSRRRA